MNRRLVSALLGYLTLFCGAAMFVPLILAAFNGDAASVAAFLLSMFMCLAATFELERFGGVKGKDNLGVREAIAITVLGWALVSLLGMVPYFAGGWLNPLDSIVESVSGFSGTGATVFNDVEILPHSILLWRSLSNWVGGLGIIVIFMAILPQFGRGAMFIFRAESTGPTDARQMPLIRDNAKALFLVYVTLTVACSIVYFLCGLTPFTAINHAMTTIATGGFGIFNGTVDEYGNAWLKLAMSFFMIVSSGSFAMYVVAVRKGGRVILRNTEFKVYLWIVLITSTVIAIDLIVEQDADILESMLNSIFHVASLSSTTGFVATDFDQWPPLSKGFLLMTMFLGGCAGSTAGGLKVARIILLFEMLIAIIKQKIHPQSVMRVKMNGQVVDDEIVYGAARFFFAVVVMDIAFAFVMMFDGIDLVNSVSVSVSTMASVGPGFGIEGATSGYSLLPTMSKIFACLFMFLSRLEIFVVLALLSPSFWLKSRRW